MFEKDTLDVVVPCFNEEQNIDSFYERIASTLNKIKINYKIIFIDDGSKDKTWQKILSLKKINENIIGIKLSRNFGHQSALKAGLDIAESDYVFSLDADLQDPPELLEEMLIKLKKENLNVVNAKKEKKNNENFLKKSHRIFFTIF